MIYINDTDKEIIVSIPLTKGTEKIRIKKRTVLNEYGLPVSTKTEPFAPNFYIEWQIGYDVITSDQEKLSNTSLPNITFVGANGKEKAIYELSEYIKYFYDWKVIKKDTLTNLLSFLESLKEEDFLDNSISHPELSIKRTSFVERTINDINFLYSKVEYPLLVHKFGNYEIITEIIIREKQYAIGTQPMLFLCFPITELKDSARLIGRTANTKERALFTINKDNITVFIELLKMFGTLSKNHNHDTISIINTILK